MLILDVLRNFGKLACCFGNFGKRDGVPSFLDAGSGVSHVISHHHAQFQCFYQLRHYFFSLSFDSSAGGIMVNRSAMRRFA